MKLQYKVLSVILGLCTSAVCVPLYYKTVTKPVNESPVVFVTAAHIPQEQMTGYKLLYADEDRDTAYYLNTNYTYTLPNVGDDVSINGIAGTVKSVKEDVGFYVTVSDNSHVYKGISGARVLDKNGDAIGFVSSSKKSGEIYCIAIR